MPRAAVEVASERVPVVGAVVCAASVVVVGVAEAAAVVPDGLPLIFCNALKCLSVKLSPGKGKSFT